MDPRRQRIADDHERAIDEYLRSKGLTVAANPHEALGSGDRVIDGQPTEYKTLTDVVAPDEDKLSKVIASVAMNARSQAADVVVDARGQPDMTESAAVRGIRRAFGADRAVSRATGGEPRLRSVRVIFRGPTGADTDIILLRSS